MYSLELSNWGDSNEYNQHTIIVQKIEKNIPNLLPFAPWYGVWLTLSGLNYPNLEQISMVPKMFEPLKFDCIQNNIICYPAIILHKSTAGRYRPVSYPDGPITAHYRF